MQWLIQDHLYVSRWNEWVDPYLVPDRRGQLSDCGNLTNTAIRWRRGWDRRDLRRAVQPAHDREWEIRRLSPPLRLPFSGVFARMEGIVRRRGGGGEA